MENQGYRAFLIGPDGHVIDRVDIFCENEDQAKQRAKGLATEWPVELWQCARKIAVFRPTGGFTI